MALGTQVFLLGPNQEFDESKFRSVRIKPSRGLNKPDGAFWTSTLEGTSSAWIDWCRWEMPRWIGDRAALFNVKSGAKVYTIRNAKDYMDLWRKHPAEVKSYGLGNHYIDWASAAREYDAVHLASDLGRGSVPELYGWDVESTAWFNTRGLDFAKMVDVEKGEKGPDDDEWFTPPCSLRVAGRYLAQR